MATALDNKKLRALVRESVREAVSAEFIKLGAFLLPYVSKAEQKDIEKRYGKPSSKPGKSYNVEA